MVGHIPTVTIGPVGSSAYEKSRFERSKANGLSEVKLHSNVPLPGFSIVPNKYNSYNNWTVIDPRGFSVAITSENLSTILDVGGVGPGGLILEKCVWVRSNTETKLTLLPISSGLYGVAVSNSQLLSNKVKLSDVNIGDHVLLPGYNDAIYMGVMSLYGPPLRYNSDSLSPQVYLRRGVVQDVESGIYYFKGDLNILSVKSPHAGPKITRGEAVARVNAAINAGKAQFTSSMFGVSSYGVHEVIRLASTGAEKEVKFSLEEIDIVDATKEFRIGENTNDCARVVFADNAGNKFLIGVPRNGGVVLYNGSSLIDTMGMEEPSSEFFSSINLNNTKSHVLCFDESQPSNLDKFVKFYKIVKHVGDETYV